MNAPSSNPKLPVRMVQVNVVSKAWPAALHPSQTVFLSLWSHLTGAKTPDSTAANDSAFPSLFSSSLYPSCLFTSPPSPTPQLHSAAPLSSPWFTETFSFSLFFTLCVEKMFFSLSTLVVFSVTFALNCWSYYRNFAFKSPSRFRKVKELTRVGELFYQGDSCVLP